MEVMSRKVATVDADANLGQAAAEMQDKNVGILPVLDGDSVAGVVTDRDLVVRGIAQHLDPESTKVRDVMSTDPVIVHMDAPVEQAAHVLAERKIGRALVVDDSSQVVGLLSMADIALAADDKEMVGDLLKHVSERYF
jgi:CBS domain-containing protein